MHGSSCSSECDDKLKQSACLYAACCPVLLEAKRFGERDPPVCPCQHPKGIGSQAERHAAVVSRGSRGAVLARHFHFPFVSVGLGFGLHHSRYAPTVCGAQSLV